MPRHRASSRRHLCAAVALLVAALPLHRAAAQGQPTTAASEAASRAAVVEVIHKLFDGMRTKDTALMRSLIDSTAVMQSNRGMTRELVGGWLRSIATSPDSVVLDERLGEPVVHVDGPLATVWVDYWFFQNTRLSHCGVDAFILARRPDAWKVMAVADTKRREGCPPAPPAKR